MEADHAIIYNPIANKGKVAKDIELVAQYLDALNVSYKLYATAYQGHAIELARSLAKDGFRVIAAGGDGTSNEVLHGTISSNSGALCGFIPMGSGNDIAAAVGYKADIKRACEIIAEGFNRVTSDNDGEIDVQTGETHTSSRTKDGEQHVDEDSIPIKFDMCRAIVGVSTIRHATKAELSKLSNEEPKD